MGKYYVLGIDPSGSYNEGKGTTGFALLNPEGKLEGHDIVEAKLFLRQTDYWLQVLNYIHAQFLKTPNLVLSVEDYVLYATSAKAQINSEMETSKLIGAITVAAAQLGIPMYLRNASQVMTRWSNEILIFKKLIVKQGVSFVDQEGNFINRHSLDAIRHAIHCHSFEVGKKKGVV